MNVKNWKLKELTGQYSIIAPDSINYLQELIAKLGLPEKHNEFISRTESYLDWENMPEHYEFFFDYEDNEDVGGYLSSSVLKGYNKVVVTYGHDEPAISIDMPTFLKNWEDFFSSTLYNSIIHTTDNKLIMEITRDYYLHSNFKIK